MDKVISLLLVVIVNLDSICGQPLTSNERSGVTIDLSYPFDDATIYWPASKRFNHTQVFRGYTPAGFYYENNDIAASEHGGTHMDAPAHLCDLGPEKCMRADDIPAWRFHGEGVLLDYSSLVTYPDDRDFQLNATSLSDGIRAWEIQRGGRHVPDGAFILLYFGWGRFWGDESKYLGNDVQNASDLHFPGLHPDAADWLVKNFPNVSMVGLDTASLDYGQSRDYQAHRKLFRANIAGLENLANLDELAAAASSMEDDDDDNQKVITIMALPMKIGDGSGAPTRVIAVVDEDKRCTSYPMAMKSDRFGMAGLVCFICVITLVFCVYTCLKGSGWAFS